MQIKKHLRAAWRVAGAAALGIGFLAGQAIAVSLFNDYDTLPNLGMKATLKLLNIKVEFNRAADTAPADAAVIYAGGPHTSYLDTFVQGAIKKGPIIVKDDITDMPVIGFIGKFSGTIFVKQGIKGQQLPVIHEQIARALNAKRNLIVFPEGDLDDGVHLLPFKSGVLSILFSNLSRIPLVGKAFRVRPFTIGVTHVNGQDVATHPELKNHYNCFGQDHGEALGRHLINLLYHDSMRVEVNELPLMNPQDYAGYKEFTEAVKTVIADGMKPGRP